MDDTRNTEARNVHSREQLLAALRETTVMALRVYRAAVEEGATPQEALAVATAFWAAIIPKGQ